jgi:hypothetical protein
MLAPPEQTPPAAPPRPVIHEATEATDGSGQVFKGKVLTRAQAEVRRQAGDSIVVCGPDELANRLEAADVEAAVGPWAHHRAHAATAGALALPHFQQRRKPPGGHSFYETASAKAS